MPTQTVPPTIAPTTMTPAGRPSTLAPTLTQTCVPIGKVCKAEGEHRPFRNCLVVVTTFTTRQTTVYIYVELCLQRSYRPVPQLEVQR
mmetsp:Transcript_34390/g.55003  ORF Transcript_34390/g.55003 Transcript_34390/m.55003 type:complete len:88 (-) Transcript_34390:464-727(-)